MTRRQWWLWASAVAVLALAASANSITNGFAYDDVYVIELPAERMRTFAGWWREFASTYWPEYGTGPGDGYRPLTILGFKAQWVLGNGSPMVFHAVNIVLHVTAAIAVFWLAGVILPIAAAWIAAALYAVHPVHTESIANVVGQSELAVAALVTFAMGLYLHARRAGHVSWPRWTAIGLLYATAMLFKEHAITLIALIPLAEFTVVRDREGWRARLGRLRVPLLAMLAIAVAYLWARAQVIPDGTGFRPAVQFVALNLSATNRVLTMIGASPEWVRLLLWPARLMTEYSPPYLPLAQGVEWRQLPGLLVLLGVLTLIPLTWKRAPAAAFGVAWMVITLLPASNFVVPAGFILAERTLLLPSVGAMIALASAVPWIYERIESRAGLQQLAVGAVVVLLLLGVWRSSTRNPAWRDTMTLMQQGVKDAPDSYRTHVWLGALMFERGRPAEGEHHYLTAIQLFPRDPYVLWALAEQYRGARVCDRALPLYRSVQEVAPNMGLGLLSYAECALDRGYPEEARAAAARWIELGGRVAPARPFFRRAQAQRDSLDARRLPSPDSLGVASSDAHGRS